MQQFPPLESGGETAASFTEQALHLWCVSKGMVEVKKQITDPTPMVSDFVGLGPDINYFKKPQYTGAETLLSS
jgi:hypothetical protein